MLTPIFCIRFYKIPFFNNYSSKRIQGAEHMADYKNLRSNSLLLKQKLNEHQQEEMRIKSQRNKNKGDKSSFLFGTQIIIDGNCSRI
jgi:hypothetical protein